MTLYQIISYTSHLVQYIFSINLWSGIARSKVLLIRLGFAAIANNSQISVSKHNKSIPIHTIYVSWRLSGGLCFTVSQGPKLPHIAICPPIGAVTFVLPPTYHLVILFKSWTNNYTIEKLWRLEITQRVNFFWAFNKMFITIASKGSTYIISLKPHSN